jgi:hypothetical protein
MTTTDPLADALDRVGGQQGSRLEAVVAVEQARAVAQVAAQVQVAQRFPRDLDRIRAELEAACQSFDLARVAFWALPNRGQGLSVHLARELAVIWGNVDYGVHELRRDDERRMSEVQAFCWDMQRNSRATRTFQVPHAVMARGKRQPIDDLQDVYRNNQNAGARAMRECVFATLPRWFVDGAERALRETLKRGDGKPLHERRRDAVTWFERQRVTLTQLERRVGRPLDRWNEEDVAQLLVVADSIRRGETTAAEQFDPAEARVTVDELAAPVRAGMDALTNAARETISRAQAGDMPAGPVEPAEPSHPTSPEPVGSQRRASQKSIGKLIGYLRDLGVESDEDQHAWLSRELQREVTTRSTLTQAEVNTTIPVVEQLIEVRDLEAAEREDGRQA